MTGLLRILFFTIIGYYIFKLVKSLLIRQPENTHVKGGENRPDNVQRKHKNRIEDADFEEISEKADK